MPNKFHNTTNNETHDAKKSEDRKGRELKDGNPDFKQRQTQHLPFPPMKDAGFKNKHP